REVRDHGRVARTRAKPSEHVPASFSRDGVTYCLLLAPERRLAEGETVRPGEVARSLDFASRYHASSERPATWLLAEIGLRQRCGVDLLVELGEVTRVRPDRVGSAGGGREPRVVAVVARVGVDPRLVGRDRGRVQ